MGIYLPKGEGTQMRTNVTRYIALSVGLLMVCVLLISGRAADARSQAHRQSQQANQPAQGKAAEAMTTATGKLVITTVDGEKEYTLQDASGKKMYYLEAGPKWFYKSAAYPLDKYADQQVTVVGVVEGPRQNKPNPQANPNASKPKQAKDAPTLEVFSINGEVIRGNGKPPWAGGPNNVPDHPGSKGKGHDKGNNGNNGNNKDKGGKSKP